MKTRRLTSFLIMLYTFLYFNLQLRFLFFSFFLLFFSYLLCFNCCYIWVEQQSYNWATPLLLLAKLNDLRFYCRSATATCIVQSIHFFVSHANYCVEINSIHMEWKKGNETKVTIVNNRWEECHISNVIVIVFVFVFWLSCVCVFNKDLAFVFYTIARNWIA